MRAIPGLNEEIFNDLDLVRVEHERVHEIGVLFLRASERALEKIPTGLEPGSMISAVIIHKVDQPSITAAVDRL